jgi:hypothetical protein
LIYLKNYSLKLEEEIAIQGWTGMEGEAMCYRESISKKARESHRETIMERPKTEPQTTDDAGITALVRDMLAKMSSRKRQQKKALTEA